MSAAVKTKERKTKPAAPKPKPAPERGPAGEAIRGRRVETDEEYASHPRRNTISAELDDVLLDAANLRLVLDAALELLDNKDKVNHAVAVLSMAREAANMIEQGAEIALGLVQDVTD